MSASASSPLGLAALHAASPTPSAASNPSTAKPVHFVSSKKRRMRGLDKFLPAALTPLIPESTLYSSLLAFERQVDAAIAQQSIRIQDVVNEPRHQSQTLRLYVWHDVNTVSPAAWTLRVVGHWVDAPAGLVGPSTAANSGPLRALGAVLDSMTIAITPSPDESEQPSELIEWRAHSSPAFTDGFEVHRVRVSAKPCVCHLALVFATWPRTYQLSSALARIVKVSQCTLARVLRGLWDHIAANRLLAPSDPTTVVPDSQLTLLMNSAAPVTLEQIMSHCRDQHIQTIEPVQIVHEIDITRSGLDTAQCFDIALPLPELPQLSTVTNGLSETGAALSYSGSNPRFDMPTLPSLVKEAADVERTIEGLLRELRSLETRRTFLHSFAADPVHALQTLLAEHAAHQMAAATTLRAQAAANAARAAETQRVTIDPNNSLNHSASLTLGTSRSAVQDAGVEERARRSEYYTQAEWIHDAIDRYLHAANEHKRILAAQQRAVQQ